MDIVSVVLGSDHGGYRLKLAIRDHLEGLGVRTADVGTETEASCNYVVYANRLCETLLAGRVPFGILVCGTGIGMSMAANKHAGIRAAVCGDPYTARMSRLHNDANVLCLGARVTGPGLAMDIVDAFLQTAFEGGRHLARVESLNALDRDRQAGAGADAGAACEGGGRP